MVDRGWAGARAGTRSRGTNGVGTESTTAAENNKERQTGEKTQNGVCPRHYRQDPQGSGDPTQSTLFDTWKGRGSWADQTEQEEQRALAEQTEAARRTWGNTEQQDTTEKSRQHNSTIPNV